MHHPSRYHESLASLDLTRRFAIDQQLAFTRQCQQRL
jgi:hypothetical protein